MRQQQRHQISPVKIIYVPVNELALFFWGGRQRPDGQEQQSIRNDSQIMMGWNWKQISSVPQMWVAQYTNTHCAQPALRNSRGEQERTQTQTDDRYDRDRKSQIWRNIRIECWDSRRHVRSTVINTNAIQVRLSEKWDFTSWRSFLGSQSRWRLLSVMETEDAAIIN